MKKQSVKMAAVVVAFISSIAITACGGGGSSGAPEATATPVPSTTPVNTPAPTPNVQIGQFLDAAVEGLRYETATQSGTTGKIGDFKFLNGETVTFWLYGTKLNTAAASVVLTPADAVDVDIDYSVNLLRFLQTVDTDNDPSNGITLPAVSAADAGYIINFKQDLYTFEADANVLAFISKYANGRTMVGIKDAITHFNSTVENVTSDVVLDVTGKTLSLKPYDNSCTEATDGVTAPVTWVINPEGTGYYENSTEYFTVPKATELRTAVCTTAPHVYNAPTPILFTNITNTMNTMYGGPKFTYAKINRIGIRSATVNPSNGLESIVVIWHTPGTKKITYQRRYIKTEGSTSTALRSTLTWVYTWE